TSPQITRPSRAVAVVFSRAMLTGFIYSALASPQIHSALVSRLLRSTRSATPSLVRVSARRSSNPLAPLFAVGQARGPPPHGEHLRQHGQRDLRRRLGAEVEADGHAHPGEQIFGDAVLTQEIEDRLPAAARPEEADVADGRLERVLEHGQIVLVVVSDQD